MNQKILKAHDNYIELDEYINKIGTKSILLVCDSSFQFLKLSKYFEEIETRLGIKIVKFNHFNSNPLYESVEEGVQLFQSEKCESIIAVGGGSAIDVAKCIKLYSNMDKKRNYLIQKIIPNEIKLLAIPTTAGTGSEATRYAVIYYEGEKQSISDYSCIPSAVLIDPSTLKTLPDYQRKSTMMDALCHAVESFWSVNSNDESKKYSRWAISKIMKCKQGYLNNEDEANAGMLEAANLAGRAINITQTTAGHALCYKLTSLYGVAHGHAAALCVSKLLPYMIENIEACIDSRGKQYLQTVFDELANVFGAKNVNELEDTFDSILLELGLMPPKINSEADYAILSNSVNPVRLKNNPIYLNEKTIDMLYHQILA